VTSFDVTFSERSSSPKRHFGYLYQRYYYVVFYHSRLGYHPAVGVAPGLFIVFAFIVAPIWTNIIVAFAGVIACTAIAFGLNRILVTPPAENNGIGNLFGDYEEIQS